MRVLFVDWVVEDFDGGGGGESAGGGTIFEGILELYSSTGREEVFGTCRRRKRLPSIICVAIQGDNGL